MVRHLPSRLLLFTYGVLACLIWGLWLLYLAQPATLVQDPEQRDFLSLYVGGRIILAGESGRLYNPTVQAQIENATGARYGETLPRIIYLYPPWNAALVLPLSALPYIQAYWIWVLLNLAVCALAIRWLLALVAPSRPERPILLLAAIGFVPLFHNVWQGQTSGMALLGLTMGVVMLRGGRDREAGLWLLLTLLKTQLIPLIPLVLLVWRRPRAITTFVIAAGAVGGVSVLLFGDWMARLAPLIQQSLDVEAREGYVSAMANWRGLLYMLIGNNSSTLAQGLEALLVALSLGMVALLCWPYSRWGRATPEVRFAAAAILLLLTSPHLYIHDLVVLLLPGFLLWRASATALMSQPGVPLRLLGWTLAAGPVVFYAFQFWHPPLVQIGAWYLALLIILALQTRLILGPDRAMRAQAKAGCMPVTEAVE